VRRAPESGAEKLIDLDEHRLGDEQLPSQVGDEAGRELARLVAAVRRRY
jgi:hypothetical protein